MISKEMEQTFADKEEFGYQLEQAVINDDYCTLELMAQYLADSDLETATWVRQLAKAAYNNSWSHDMARDEEAIESYVA